MACPVKDVKTKTSKCKTKVSNAIAKAVEAEKPLGFPEERKELMQYVISKTVETKGAIFELEQTKKKLEEKMSDFLKLVNSIEIDGRNLKEEYETYMREKDLETVIDLAEEK